MSERDMCSEVRGHVSRWADDRLDAAVRAEVQAHIDGCPACRIEFAAIRELSRRVGELEPDTLPDGFAARVREAAIGAGNEHVGPPWYGGTIAVRVAAAACVLLTVALAYFIGRDHGREHLEGSGDDFVASALPVAAHDSPAYLRAARSVASDLGVIDRIPARMRRPLLRAQIDHFDLDRWAHAVRRVPSPSEPARDLAALISNLVDSLEDETRFEAEMTSLRDRAMRPSIWSGMSGEMFVGVDVGARDRRGPRDRVLRHAARHMSSTERSGLDRLLEFKEHLADGNPWPLLSLGRDGSDVPAGLLPSVEVMLASSFGAAGLDEVAATWMRPLREQSPDVFQLLSTTVFGGRDPLRLQLGLDGGDLERRLQSLFDRSQGAGELVIQESTEDGGYSFHVFIRTEQEQRKNR